MATTKQQRAVHAARHEAHLYAAGAERPLGSFTGFMAAYAGAVVAGAGITRALGQRLPERLETRDLALLSVATHKISRLLTKDPVTSPLRAPFTEFRGKAGEGELAEEVRGTGLRKAMGELVTCPFCVGQWIATSLAFGFVVAPRPTRWAASLFTALAAADFLQFAYSAADQAQEQLGEDG